MCVSSSPPPLHAALFFLLVCLLNMDVAAIRSLMRKTQASILENGFLGLEDPKHVSVASFTSLLILSCVF